MNNSKTVEWILRIGVAGEFIGHGLLAIGGKKDWVGWFSKFGISDVGLATQILFFIGLTDVLLAVLVLIKPIRIALLWMTFWAFWTALLRPIVGVGWLDFVERSANWAAPLALIFLIGWPKQAKEWLK